MAKLKKLLVDFDGKFWSFQKWKKLQITRFFAYLDHHPENSPDLVIHNEASDKIFC